MPKAKKSLVKNLNPSTEFVSKIPRIGIIKRVNGYSAFFEMLKFIMISFIKHLQDSNSFMICQARNEDIDMSYVALYIIYTIYLIYIHPLNN